MDIDDGGGGDDHIKGHCIYEGWRISGIDVCKDVTIFLMMLSGGLLMSKVTDE